MDPKAHWEILYVQRRPGEVSWYQPHLTVSLNLLANAGLRSGCHVIDVGGGAPTLVDDLLDQGVTEITVLDVSGRALSAAKERLGAQANRATWMEADITHVQLPSSFYDIWHDRAVLHFLTKAADRRRYLDTMRSALKPEGHAVLATFALDGPPRCSGLEIIRYSPETLCAEVGGGFMLREVVNEAHRTPSKTMQQFQYCCFQRVAS